MMLLIYSEHTNQRYPYSFWPHWCKRWIDVISCNNRYKCYRANGWTLL